MDAGVSGKGVVVARGRPEEGLVVIVVGGAFRHGPG
jgi:hypothetical protein